jgi:C4-dicarboxylate-specific signal transduction histidine kinase
MRDFTRRSAETRRHEDLGAVLRESLELVQYELRRAKVAVDLQQEDDLPQVSIDRVQIQQVLVNLFKNASEALESQAEDARRMHITLRNAGENLCIEVADNGPGLQQLAGGDPFEPFVTSKTEGMGMGLPISRTIIEAHGGAITAKNNDRGGATFTFWIPAARSSN